MLRLFNQTVWVGATYWKISEKRLEKQVSLIVVVREYGH